MQLKLKLPRKTARGGVCDGLGSAFAAIMSTTPFSFFLTKYWGHFINRCQPVICCTLFTGALLVLAGLFPVLEH